VAFPITAISAADKPFNVYTNARYTIVI
jgi:hypothetical protein